MLGLTQAVTAASLFGSFARSREELMPAATSGEVECGLFVFAFMLQRVNVTVYNNYIDVFWEQICYPGIT
jgi:hypothetical protein